MAKVYCIFRKGTNKIIDVVPENQFSKIQLNTTCDYKIFNSESERLESKLRFCDLYQENLFHDLIRK
jgi:hypothetical protein